MLQGLRQHGFMLNGCLAALLLASLLLSSLAPCLAAAHNAPQAAMTHEMGGEMGGMEMAKDMSGMDGHCPHCEVVTTPCMASAVDCAAQPAALFKTPETERQIDKPLAVMPQVVEPPTVAQASIAAVFFTLQPCKISGRDRRVLFCSFQE